MPIPIKYTTTNVSNSVRLGNIALGVNAVDYGPSSTTGFTNGVSPANGGYAIYYLSGTNIRMRTAADDATLITVAGQIMGTTYTSVSGSLIGLAGGGYTVINTNPPNLVTSGSSVMLNSKLVMSYPQNGTAWYDLSGNVNNGTVTNGPTFESTTGALIFDGTDDYVGFANQTQFQTPTFTVDGVISPTAGNSGTIVLFTRESARLNLGIAYGGSTGAYFFIRGSNYPTAELNGVQQAYTFTNGLFYYVTFIVDIPGNNYKFYVNGNQVWSSTIALGTNFQSPTNTQGVIASRYGGAAGQAKCRISSFNFYNRVLGADEIAQNYYQGNIVTSSLALALDAGNLVSYPGSGTTWTTLTGSNGGTLTNGPTFSLANGGAIVFDGVDDYVDLGNSTVFQPSSITFCMWVKRTSTWGAGSCLFWAKPNGNYAGTGFYVEPVAPSTSNYTNIVFDGFPNYIQLQVDGNTTFPLNTPIHFCFTLSGGVGAIYVNGISKTISTVGTPTITSTFDTKYIMSNSPSYATYTPGVVYSTLLYNRALSASEIQQNFNAQRNRFNL